MKIVISIAQFITFVLALAVPFLGTVVYAEWLQSAAGLAAALPLTAISMMAFGPIGDWLYAKKKAITKDKDNG